MSRSRAAFSAVEMLVVIGIITVLATMTAPSIIEISRRNAARGGAEMIQRVWQEAQILASRSLQPSGATPAHWGVWVRQEDGQPAVVSLIYSSATSGSIAAEQAVGDARRRELLSPQVSLVSRALSTDAWNYGAQEHLWYAQYATGLPLAASVIAAGQATASTAIGVGVGASPIPGLSPLADLQVRTHDYDTVSGEGLAYAFKLYPIGIATVEAVTP